MATMVSSSINAKSGNREAEEFFALSQPMEIPNPTQYVPEVFRSRHRPTPCFPFILTRATCLNMSFRFVSIGLLSDLKYVEDRPV